MCPELIVVIVQETGESLKAKKAEEQAKTAPEPPLEKAIIDHFSETLLPGRLPHHHHHHHRGHAPDWSVAVSTSCFHRSRS